MAPVLYIEDEANDVFFMQYAWEAAAIEQPLLALKNGQEAMQYLAGEPPFADREKHPLPCLLLLDLKLPIKSGFEVLTWVRHHPTLRSLRVVIVSGSELDADIERAPSRGVADYVVKPSSPAELTEILKQRYPTWLDSAGTAEQQQAR